MIAKQHDSACEYFQASKFQFSIRKLFILHPSGERHKKKAHSKEATPLFSRSQTFMLNTIPLALQT